MELSLNGVSRISLGEKAEEDRSLDPCQGESGRTGFIGGMSCITQKGHKGICSVQHNTKLESKEYV